MNILAINGILMKGKMLRCRQERNLKKLLETLIMHL